MTKNIILSVAAGAIAAACQSFSAPTAGPVSAALAPAPMPDLRPGTAYTVVVDGERQEVVTLLSKSGNASDWADNDGWSWTTTGPFPPPLAWKGPDDEGQMTVEGEMNDLFPLEVGKSMTVSLDGRSTSYPQGWSHSRRCTVDAQESVTVPAGTFDAFKVVCIQGQRLSDPFQTRTYYYAPAVQTVVYEHVARDGRPDETTELVSLPGSAGS